MTERFTKAMSEQLHDHNQEPGVNSNGVVAWLQQVSNDLTHVSASIDSFKDEVRKDIQTLTLTNSQTNAALSERTAKLETRLEIMEKNQSQGKSYGISILALIISGFTGLCELIAPFVHR